MPSFVDGKDGGKVTADEIVPGVLNVEELI